MSFNKMMKSSIFSRINKVRLLYNYGEEAGFFSEYNNLLLCVLYCLCNNISMDMYTANKKFSCFDAWQDFFLPFCNINNSMLSFKYNKRQPSVNESLNFKIKRKIIKKILGYHLFGNEIWNEFHSSTFSSKTFSCKYFNNYDILSALKYIHNIIWNYNYDTGFEIKKIIEKVNIKEPYIGLHIRSGDKCIEHNIIDISVYMKKVKELTNIKQIFVMTDDYSIIKKITKEYSDYKLYYLTEPNETGYVHQQFIKLNCAEKKYAHLKLLASMDILSSSELFIGSYSSNPGMHLGYRLDKNKIFCLDYKDWLIW